MEEGICDDVSDISTMTVILPPPPSRADSFTEEESEISPTRMHSYVDWFDVSSNYWARMRECVVCRLRIC